MLVSSLFSFFAVHYTRRKIWNVHVTENLVQLSKSSSYATGKLPLEISKCLQVFHVKTFSSYSQSSHFPVIRFHLTKARVFKLFWARRIFKFPVSLEVCSKFFLFSSYYSIYAIAAQIMSIERMRICLEFFWPIQFCTASQQKKSGKYKNLNREKFLHWAKNNKRFKLIW